MKVTRDTIIKRREYLIKRQKELGLTNYEISEQLGISLRYYSRLLDGIRGKHMGASLMRRICKVFKFQENEFLRLECEYLDSLLR